MRGVGDDDGGVGDLGAGSLEGDLAGHAEPAALDLRVAFHGLALVLDLLAGHAKVLGVLPALVEVVDDADDQQDGQEPGRELDEQLEHGSDHAEEGERGEECDVVEPAAEHEVRDGGDHDELDGIGERLDEVSAGKEAADALDGIEPLELWLEGVGGEEQAGLADLGEPGDEDHGAEKGEGGLGGSDGDGAEEIGDGKEVRAARSPAVLEDLAHDAAEGFDEECSEDGEEDGGADEFKGGGEVGALGDLAASARLFETFGRGLLGTFA
ncbi:MAG: hypothetical protein GIKADHBN_02802 [Phycisphaerales bacterium]|nr:hypothetical protein [Phycisphaerales bacterium]